jgi:hypothetical protein
MSFFLTDLLEAVRKSGLDVIEVGGWRVRGHGGMTAVETIVVHHTATPRTVAGDYPSLGIVRDGRSDLAGPLAQLGLGRSGKVYVIAAGVCFHAGDTQSVDQGNWHAIGIEAEADGLSPWPPAQVDAYARLCAALCEHYGLSVDRVQGHKEVCRPRGRKTDPNFEMASFRDRVAEHMEDEMKDADWTRLEELIDARLDAAEDRIKYESPSGQKVAKRKWFEGLRKSLSKP